jgi:hypothetical protein
MAVILIGGLFFLAGVVFFVVTLRQRSQGHVRRVSGVPAGSHIHTELELGSTHGTATTAAAVAHSAHSPASTAPRQAPEPALAGAVGAAPTAAPVRESYYAVAPPNRAKGRPTGWYSVNGILSDERFWDGGMWSARRQLVEGVWASAPLAD